MEGERTEDVVRDWKWETERGQEPKSRSQDRLSTHWLIYRTVTTLVALGMSPIYR